ncbi:MAG: OmpA family protein [Gemmatimonadaceae bacterium]|nr:OmpA family protein [Gemmatimonadaceae bacterium]
MPRPPRLLTVAVLGLSLLAACRKKQAETAPTPTSGPAPAETCDAACRAARAAAEKAARDSAEAARLRAEAEARERAMAGLKATLAQKVLFDYDMAELSASAEGVLNAKVAILLANTGLRLRISGHADERGSDEYNLALGQRRAAAVKRYFTDRGVDGSRLDIVSFGEERPEATDGTEDAFRLNRRAEFEITAGGDNLVPPKS